MTGTGATPDGVDLVVDVANVMGSRPDGWWRDRVGAATRLLVQLSGLTGTDVPGPDGSVLLVEAVVGVVEGAARRVPDQPGVQVVRATTDGDTAVVEVCARLLAAGRRPLAVTADRGLRMRLPSGTAVAGPGWLLTIVIDVPTVAAPHNLNSPSATGTDTSS